MRFFMLACSAVLAVIVSGCPTVSSGDAGGVLPASDGGVDGGGTLGFGAPCESSDQCVSGVCFEFGDGTKGCTQKCASADDCPPGSQGKKCNNQGVCRV